MSELQQLAIKLVLTSISHHPDTTAPPTSICRYHLTWNSSTPTTSPANFTRASAVSRSEYQDTREDNEQDGSAAYVERRVRHVNDGGQRQFTFSDDICKVDVKSSSYSYI